MNAVGRFLLVLLPALTLAQGEDPITEKDRAHWAFRPPIRVVPPEVTSPASDLQTIDRFLLARMEQEGLAFAPEADKRTLIRRVTFGLTGLPPQPRDVEAFLQDHSPEAYLKVVNRLLDSSAYGEYWAQHWLDVARFAESDGFEHDLVRKDAWRYRDWVIEALNADLPYDRFVQLQLAADEIAPGDQAAQRATGYLLAGPDMPDINLLEERRHSFLNSMTATVGQTFLALTLGCAQCHDHRTDPVSIDDFYRLRAVFTNTTSGMKPNKQLGHFVKESGSSVPTSFVMARGDFRSPDRAVEPAFLRVLNPERARISPPPAEAHSSMRRAAFARWLTRPDHPLTGRVMVNRLWQQYFGRGLVTSAGDFGHTGEEPSHPQLLDWLATEFPNQGWSLKALHRVLVTSRAYRQASRGETQAWKQALERDPPNTLLSRMPRKRLEGEAIRDTFLAISGLLNRKAGGPSIRPPLPVEITSTMLKNQWKVTEDENDHRRRSIYLFARRNLRFPMFDVFDRPDSNISCSRRDQSTTAPQSLTLLNSEFSSRVATALAKRVRADAPSPDERIQRVYALIFARNPSPTEHALGLRFLQETNDGLDHYCLALLNTNEAIYID
ncbi:MAG: DUF1553 domain-containing protein [Rhodobacterales bacterium]|nr:DUF1553 domain-containing protein [Rhodobacterales bacterium]